MLLEVSQPLIPSAVADYKHTNNTKDAKRCKSPALTEAQGCLTPSQVSTNISHLDAESSSTLMGGAWGSVDVLQDGLRCFAGCRSPLITAASN